MIAQAPKSHLDVHDSYLSTNLRPVRNPPSLLRNGIDPTAFPKGSASCNSISNRNHVLYCMRRAHHNFRVSANALLQDFRTLKAFQRFDYIIQASSICSATKVWCAYSNCCVSLKCTVWRCMVKGYSTTREHLDEHCEHELYDDIALKRLRLCHCKTCGCDS